MLCNIGLKVIGRKIHWVHKLGYRRPKVYGA